MKKVAVTFVKHRNANCNITEKDLVMTLVSNNAGDDSGMLGWIPYHWCLSFGKWGDLLTPFWKLHKIYQ